MFTRTEEPLVLEDEREQEREEEDNETVEQSEETTVEGQSALHLPSKKTVGSEKAVRHNIQRNAAVNADSHYYYIIL